ncbi:unnamed protein product [Blepharisma stoltei]|uniref:Uncharacterized protein n=1 Tax=Blepharisma stoltei TaxID=1481888 RepID=A0AAU9IWW0_9CILI|nr:unnamed protein product [Blepharisma stoltei]
MYSVAIGKSPACRKTFVKTLYRPSSLSRCMASWKCFSRPASFLGFILSRSMKFNGSISFCATSSILGLSPVWIKFMDFIKGHFSVFSVIKVGVIIWFLERKGQRCFTDSRVRTANSFIILWL